MDRIYTKSVKVLKKKLYTYSKYDIFLKASLGEELLPELIDIRDKSELQKVIASENKKFARIEGGQKRKETSSFLKDEPLLSLFVEKSEITEILYNKNFNFLILPHLKKDIAILYNDSKKWLKIIVLALEKELQISGQLCQVYEQWFPFVFRKKQPLNHNDLSALLAIKKELTSKYFTHIVTVEGKVAVLLKNRLMATISIAENKLVAESSQKNGFQIYRNTMSYESSLNNPERGLVWWYKHNKLPPPYFMITDKYVIELEFSLA